MNRNEDDIKAIFMKYYPFLVLFSRKIVGIKEDAEDIVLNVFARVIPDFPKYNTENKIKALLFLSTKNASFNQLTNSKVKRINNYKYSQLVGETYEEYDNSKAEILMKVYAHASTLPDKCQQVFYLSCIKGLRGSQIAEALNVSVDTVFTQRRIAIHSIRKHLKLTYNV